MKLKLDRLSKTFGENTVVLDDVSLEIDAHSIVLLGPSGGGKTTLLRMIAGLENPSNGGIIINGKTIPYQKELPARQSKLLRGYRRNIGVVFQNYNLFPHLDALTNITLPLEKVHNLSAEEAHARAEDLLTRFQLISHALKKPSQLSGGQKQRIAISRAMAAQPDFLLFDEPTSALDPELTSEVLDMIYELREESKVDIIIVTHHMGFASHVSDYVAFVGKRSIPVHGKPDDVFNQTQDEEVQNFFKKILTH